MAEILEFPKPAPPTVPQPPLPPAASAKELLAGKCTVRFTCWLTDTLLGRLVQIAELYQTNVSSIIRQSAASWAARQAIMGRITSDALRDLERILPLVIQEHEDGQITEEQIVMFCHRTARAVKQVIEGRRAA